MAAFDHVLRGRYHLNLDEMDDELTARHHFEQALICDDKCAAGYAGLAMSYVHEYRAFWTEDHDGALPISLTRHHAGGLRYHRFHATESCVLIA